MYRYSQLLMMPRIYTNRNADAVKYSQHTSPLHFPLIDRTALAFRSCAFTLTLVLRPSPLDFGPLIKASPEAPETTLLFFESSLTASMIRLSFDGRLVRDDFAMLDTLIFGFF